MGDGGRLLAGYRTAKSAMTLGVAIDHLVESAERGAERNEGEAR